jgi:hypothetical protein
MRDVTGFAEDHDGSIWMAAGGEGLLRLIASHRGRPNDFGNAGVWSIIEDRPGVRRATTYQGLHHYEITTDRSRRYRHDPRNPTGPPEQSG